MIKVCKPTKPDVQFTVWRYLNLCSISGTRKKAVLELLLWSALTCKYIYILISECDSVEKRINVAACKVSAQINRLTYYKTKPSIEEVL